MNWYELRVYIACDDYIDGKARTVRFPTLEKARDAHRFLANCKEQDNREWVAEHATVEGGGVVSKVYGIYRVERVA